MDIRKGDRHGKDNAWQADLKETRLKGKLTKIPLKKNLR